VESHFKRETWYRTAKVNEIAVIFVIGKSVYDQTNEDVKIENEKHQDLLQYSFIDSYMNLTIKSLTEILFLADNFPDAELSIRIDDDAFLNIPKLLQDFSSNEHYERNSIIGFLANQRPVRTNSYMWGKYLMPKQVYPLVLYPPFIVGGFSILTRGAATEMAAIINQSLPAIHLEDVFCTGILPLKANLHKYVIPNNGRLLFNTTLEKEFYFFSMKYFSDQTEFLKGKYVIQHLIYQQDLILLHDMYLSK